MSEARTTPRRKTTRKRSAEVLDATARVFHEKGYEATSIQDIADELGILKGSVYYYITSKEDILFEVLDEVHRGGFEFALQAVEIEGGPLDKIQSFVSALSRFNAENRERMAILLRDLRALKPARRRQIVQDRDRYETILRELIIEGQQQSVIAADIDPKITTLALMGMVNNIHQWYKPSGGLKPPAIGKMYGDLAVRTLTGSPVIPAPPAN